GLPQLPTSWDGDPLPGSSQLNWHGRAPRRPVFMNKILNSLLLGLIATGIASAQECAPVSGQPLRVGVLPVMNTMPLYVAAQQGFYEQHGLTVELVPLESARDRSIGLQTGQLGVGNNDVMGAVLQVASGDELKIVKHDSFAAGVPFFSIVTSADSGLD